MTATGTAPAAQWRVDLDDYVHVLEVYRDRGQAVVGSLGGDAVLIDTDDGSATALGRHEMGVLSAAWSSDGSRVAVGGQDGYVRIYDRTGAAQGAVAASAWATALAWSPTAPVLAIGAGRRLLITDQDGALLHDFDDQPSTVTAVAWSTDGTRVGAAAYGGIGWHDVVGRRTGRRRRFEWKGSMLSLVMSPDGAWACAGAQDATVQLWRLWSGRDLSMSGYPSKIERLQFRHDSRWLAVACLDEAHRLGFRRKGAQRHRAGSCRRSRQPHRGSRLGSIRQVRRHGGRRRPHHRVGRPNSCRSGPVACDCTRVRSGDQPTPVGQRGQPPSRASRRKPRQTRWRPAAVARSAATRRKAVAGSGIAAGPVVNEIHSH